LSKKLRFGDFLGAKIRLCDLWRKSLGGDGLWRLKLVTGSSAVIEFGIIFYGGRKGGGSFMVCEFYCCTTTRHSNDVEKSNECLIITPALAEAPMK